MSPATDEPIFHIVELARWEEAQATGRYHWASRKRTFEEEGFVHCLFAHQLPAVLDSYRDVSWSDLVILELDPHALPVVIEDPDGGPYPHVYGELPLKAVVRVHRGRDG
jgi:2-haloacid dehalogenase